MSNSKVWLELKQRNNNFLENWYDKGKGPWVPRGGKLWEGKFMWVLIYVYIYGR